MLYKSLIQSQVFLFMLNRWYPPTVTTNCLHRDTQLLGEQSQQKSYLQLNLPVDLCCSAYWQICRQKMLLKK